MRAQGSWQAFEYYHEIGEEAFESIKNEDIDWLKVDLKADMIIKTGLSPSTVMEAVMEAKAQRSTRQK